MDTHRGRVWSAASNQPHNLDLDLCCVIPFCHKSIDGDEYEERLRPASLGW